MAGGAADHRLSIGYLVHDEVPPPPSPLRTPPAPGGLVVPPLWLPPLGGSGCGGGGGGGGGGGSSSGGSRSAAATLAPRLWTSTPVVTAGVGPPAAPGGRPTAADAASSRPTGWCRGVPPRPPTVGSPVTILSADVATRPDGWLTAARLAPPPSAPRPPAAAHGWRPYPTAPPYGVAVGSAGAPPVVPLPRDAAAAPPHAPRRAVGAVGGGAGACPTAAADGAFGGGALPRRARHGRGAAAGGGPWPPRGGGVAKPRVVCGRGCGRSFGNRSGTLAVGRWGEGGRGGPSVARCGRQRRRRARRARRRSTGCVCADKGERATACLGGGSVASVASTRAAATAAHAGRGRWFVGEAGRCVRPPVGRGVVPVGPAAGRRWGRDYITTVLSVAGVGLAASRPTARWTETDGTRPSAATRFRGPLMSAAGRFFLARRARGADGPWERCLSGCGYLFVVVHPCATDCK